MRVSGTRWVGMVVSFLLPLVGLPSTASAAPVRLTLLQKVVSPNPVSNGRFGTAVAMDGNKAVVGESGFFTPFVQQNGSVYLTNGVTGQLLNTFSSGLNDQFGAAVALSNNTILIGAPQSSTYTGYVTVVDAISGTVIRQLASPSPDVNQSFGISVALSGNQAVVGQSIDHTLSTPLAGVVHLFNALSGNLARASTIPTPRLATSLGLRSPSQTTGFSWAHRA